MIEDRPSLPSAGEMVDDPAADRERVAHRFHALVQPAGEHRDPVTENLATGRSAVHENASWILRASARVRGSGRACLPQPPGRPAAEAAAARTVPHAGEAAQARLLAAPYRHRLT